MNLFKFSSLFNLYYLIRMKCPFRSYFNWLVHFIFLVNLSLVFICCTKPSEIFETNKKMTFWGYFLALLLYPPWIFGTQTLLTDSIFFFCICVVPFLIIIYSQAHIKKFSNQKHVNFWCALVIRICQQILTPYCSVPIMFRFSYLIEQVFILKSTEDPNMVLSFVICSLNVCLEVIHTYFASIFLIPIDFVSHSKADYYDGKYMTSLYIVRVILAVVCFELSYIKNTLIAVIVFSSIFVICFLTLYIRLTYQVHVSPVGHYLEVLPFFVCPFMVIFNYFVHNENYSLILLLLLFVVFAVLFRFQTRFIIKQCLKTFYPFMGQNKMNLNDNNNNNNNNKDFLPKFFVGSVITVIRTVACEHSDPDCLVRFLAYQKKSSEVKNLYTIEVVRFLALFPSRRKECLKELKNVHCKSNFNSFTVFIFKKILKSLDEVESTEKNLVCLNNFYRSFLVHKHLYWVARAKKQVFIASKEALSAAYFFIEVKNEFHYLMKRYTYDSFLHYYYADFCLSACGDFEEYLVECQIARMLDHLFYKNNVRSNEFVNKNSISFSDEFDLNSIVDPLLHPMSVINPKILQFCSTEKTLINLPSAKKNEVMINRQASISSKKKKEKKYEKSSPVATFLTRKKYLIPLLSIFHMYVPIALFLYLISELYIKDRYIHSQTYQLYNTSNQFLDVFYIASTSVYLPYLSYQFTRMNTKSGDLSFIYNSSIFNNNQTMETFLDLPFNIVNFYSKSQPLSNMTSGALFILERYISSNMLRNYTIKTVIDKIPYDLDFFVQTLFNNVYEKVKFMKDHAIILREIYKSNLDSYYFCKVILITICVFAVLSSIVYLIQINIIYRNDRIKIGFLSSEDLFSLFLLQESKKAWELLREFIETSSDATTADGNFNSSRSSVNLTNIQMMPSNLNAIILNFNENRPNLTNTNSIQEPLLEMAVNGHNFNKDFRSLINSNNFIQINSSNFKLKFNSKKRKRTETKAIEYEEENNEEEEEHETNKDKNNNNNNNEDDEDAYFDNEEEEDIVHPTLIQENNNCIQAIAISRATEKEAFLSCPYFHLVILLFAPLIFTILVILLFQLSLSSFSATKEETFKNILIGESLANHSFILLNSTFYILEKRVGITSKRGEYLKKHKQNENEIEIWKKEFKQFLLNEKEISNEFKYFDSKLKKNNTSKHIKEIKKSFNKLYKSFSNSKSYSNDIVTSHEKEKIDGLDEILSDLKELNSYHAEKCYEFIDVVCMSVETSIETILDTNTPPSILASHCIPFVYLFSWNLFQDLLYSNINDLYFMKISNGTSFVIGTVLLMLTVVHVSFSSSLLLRKAFNSLFHFPDDFLKPPSNISKDNSKSSNEKLPQNALVVTSITDSDEIYSVSDNSKEIINRSLNDLISLKMSTTFPKVVQNTSNNSTDTSSTDYEESGQICEFSISDTKKKTFRFSTEKIGCLTKTVMVEENSPVVENPREKTYVQLLNSFIPPYFAENYGKNNQTEFIYENNFIISVRISDEISPQMIEKCFNAANHISQYSMSIDIISVEGEMVTFSSVSNVKLIVILLLIRDFIDDVSKNTKIENCVYSIYIKHMDRFSINVLNGDEPYLEFHPHNQDYFRFRLFQIEKGKIGFSENFRLIFNSILDITEKNSIKTDFEGLEETVYALDINELSSKIAHFV